MPVSDTSCWIYTYAWHPDRPLTSEERARFEKGGYGEGDVFGAAGAAEECASDCAAAFVFGNTFWE